MEKFDNRKLAYMIMNSEDNITLAIKALAEACGDSPVVNGNTLSVELPKEYMQLVESTLNKEVDSVREEFRRISDRLKIVSGPRSVMSGPHIADEFKEWRPISSENGDPVNLCYNPLSILNRVGKTEEKVHKMNYIEASTATVDIKNPEILEDLIKLIAVKEGRIAVTGAIGSGKSTFIKWLIKFTKKEIPTIAVGFPDNFFSKDFNNDNEGVESYLGTYISMKFDEIADKLEVPDDFQIFSAELVRDRDTCKIVSLLEGAKFSAVEHHAQTTEGLISAIRNSIVAHLGCEVSVAEQIAAGAFDFNIHLAITSEGLRYVERVTAIYTSENTSPCFMIEDILVFDVDSKRYKLVGKLLS